MNVSLANRFAVLSFALFLSACAGVRLVPAYNPDIVDGVNAYHTEVLEFISTMETKRTPITGTYKSKPVTTFYAAAAASLGNLVVQAEAAEPNGKCGTSRVASLGLAAVTDEASDLSAQLDDALGRETPTLSDTELTTGSCTVIVLKALLANHNSVRDMHQLEGKLVGTSARLLRDLMNDAVRITLTAEKSKL